MSSEERKKILEMVAEGRINAEEAAKLMRVLDDAVQEPIEVIPPASTPGWEKVDAPEFEQVQRRARKFSGAFIWIGVFITVLTAWAMSSILQNAGVNFWFLCMSMPLFLGILLLALGASSRTSRWIYVDVDRRKSRKGDGPLRITLAFPLPLGFASWFIKNFGHLIEGLKDQNIDLVLQAIAATRNMTEPIIVNVDNSDEGETVQVFIG